MPTRCLTCRVLIVRGSRCIPCQRVHRKPHAQRRAAAGASGWTWSATRKRVIARDGRCLLCGSAANLEVDHVVPVARGGTSDDVVNLQTLCSSCDARKGAR